jgi:decaprenyl-phosphate phosphoribosyltransferase
LSIAGGKRQVELLRLGGGAAAHRSALGYYSVRGLRAFQLTSVAAMSATYCGWALSRSTGYERGIGALSLVPVMVAFARVSLLNARGEGGAPELLLLCDRWVQLAAFAWTIVFVGGFAHV